MSNSLLTLADMEQYVGTEAKPHVLHVERELVRRFLEAVLDSDPQQPNGGHTGDVECGAIVPPYIFCAVMTIARCSPEAERVRNLVPGAVLPCKNVLDGGATWEFFAPLRIGDTITSRVRLADVKRHEGRRGETFMLTYEAVSVNQQGELVARSINTIVNY